MRITDIQHISIFIGLTCLFAGCNDKLSEFTSTHIDNAILFATEIEGFNQEIPPTDTKEVGAPRKLNGDVCIHSEDVNYLRGKNYQSTFVASLETRAAPATSISGSFGVFCCRTSANWATTDSYNVIKNEEVKSSNSVWTTDKMHYWSDYKHSFFAYYPYSANLFSSSTQTSGYPKFTYTVPERAADEKDILVATSLNVDGSKDANVSLNFKHILTQVLFKVGSKGWARGLTQSGSTWNEGTIKSITIKGAYKANTYEIGKGWQSSLSGTGTFVSSPSYKTKSTDANVVINGSTNAFMMIPQTVPSGAQLSVVWNDGKSDHTFSINIAGDKWLEGHTYTYVIDPQSANYVIDVIPPVGGFAYTGTYTKTFSIASYKWENGKQVAVPWRAQFSTDGRTWTTNQPDWISKIDISGSGGVTPVVYNLKANKATATPITYDHSSIIQKAATKGSINSPYDLSLHDLSGKTIKRSTANCYVINSPGTYMFPMVYGNALRNGVTNTEAYNAVDSIKGKSYILSPLVKHDDSAITNPWINQNKYANGSTIKVASVKILWSDVKDMVSGIAIKNNDYVQFTINKPVEGNVVIGAYNASGTILWSWHIWVSSVDLTETYTLQTHSGNKLQLMTKYLGWAYNDNSSNVQSYGGRTYYIRILQTEDNGKTFQKHSDFSISQDKCIVDEAKGNCPYYQWGRKDPMLPSTGTGNVDKAYYNNSLTWAITKYQPSIGEMTQNPFTFYNFNASYSAKAQYHNLWDNHRANMNDDNDTIVVKTIYDPSPLGYHLPPGNAFTGWTTTGEMTRNSDEFNVEGNWNYGWNFYCEPNRSGNTFFLFAVGSRPTGAGYIAGYNEESTLWRAVDNYDGDGYSMFVGSYLNPRDHSNRDNAVPIVPVKDDRFPTP
jgi:hypothetical protein